MAATISTPAAGKWLKGYVLFVLLLVTVCNQIDRQVLSILLEPIKREFHASDTQLGLLAGVYFMAFYVIGGIPIARLGDTRSRRVIIAACVGAWSVATALSGAARSYAQLAIARTAVAIGEGGSAPAITSLLADIFPATTRVRALSVISGGSAIGIAFGTFLGGVLNETLGWRMVFVVVSLPGLVLAPLVWFTVPEVRRRVAGGGEARSSLLRTISGFWRIPSFRVLAVIAVTAGATGFATLAWMPTFLIRVHHMSSGQVGVRFGEAVVLGMMFGNLSAGFLADRLGRRSPSWILWVSGIGLAFSVPVGLASVFAQSGAVAVALFGLFTFLIAFWPPTVAACAVSVVEPAAKTLAAATVLAFQSIGGAVGPFAVGAMNDQFAASYGLFAIRYSTAVSMSGCAIAAVACFFAGRSLTRDYRRA